MHIYTIKEACKLLKVSRNTLIKNLDYNGGSIATFRLGEKSIRILEGSLDNYMETASNE